MPFACPGHRRCTAGRVSREGTFRSRSSDRRFLNLLCDGESVARGSADVWTFFFVRAARQLQSAAFSSSRPAVCDSAAKRVIRLMDHRQRGAGVCDHPHIAVRESAQQWPHRNVRLLVASTFLAAGVGATVRLGQLSWWLALSVTIAWRAARQKRSVVAGFWLGLAIGVKPFLLLLFPIVAIRREMVIAIVATVTALASLAAGVVPHGWPSARDWAHLPRDAASVRAAALFHQRVDCRTHLARRAAARSHRSPRSGCRSWHRRCCPAR